jgi:MFS transporter, DHA1 family, multidrug resistance protein
VMLPLTLLMFSWIFIQSNCMALALTDHPLLAGTAAGLLGVSQFAFAAVVAPLTGVGGNDTAVPMAVIITACGIGAALAFRTLVPTRSRRPLPVASSEV